MKKLLLLALVLPLISIAQQTIYTNLVFEGGGIRGLAYAGALKALEEKGILNNIEKTGGTSAGAIAALMVSLNYSPKEIDSIMRNLDLEDFNDGRGGFIGKYTRLKRDYGMYHGRYLSKWLEEIIAAKTGNANTTFTELHELHLKDKSFKDLYCTGTNVSKQVVEVFSFESTPGMYLKTAVRISGSIPIYFDPVYIDSTGREPEELVEGKEYQLYVDGGLIANYPIGIFDTCLNGSNPLWCDQLKFNKATLGLKLERPQQIDSFHHSSTTIPPYKIKSLNDYLIAFTNLMMETLNRKSPGLENEKGRTIYISYGDISSRIRKTSENEKDALFSNGYKAVQAFFSQ
ncbi:MAG: patatin-like phospholipase family protein [Sphingobacteriales bacterium]|nr:patatin-like phospholipase family protein [Sphingobacteriales bacterium]MBI3718118.1 patatin-like phospholipase family protein [Sphingobacteriales bacterium]